MSGAVIIIRQKRIIRAFVEAGATRADRAASPDDLRIRQTFPFRRLVAHRVLVPAGTDRYYVDIEQAERLSAWRRVIGLTMLFVFVVAVVVMLLLNR